MILIFDTLSDKLKKKQQPNNKLIGIKYAGEFASLQYLEKCDRVVTVKVNRHHYSSVASKHYQALLILFLFFFAYFREILLHYSLTTEVAVGGSRFPQCWFDRFQSHPQVIRAGIEPRTFILESGALSTDPPVPVPQNKCVALFVPVSGPANTVC